MSVYVINNGMSDVKVLDLLWGTGQRPTRGPKPSLDLAGIVRVAIEIADADGLAAVTMRRVATELGFTTMALYRHVPGKHELVQLMVDAAIPPPKDHPPATGDWRADLTSWAIDYYRGMRAHPWLLGPATVSPVVGPNRIAFMERGLAAMADAGMPADEMMGVLLTLTSYAHGAAQVFHGTADSARAQGIPESEFGAAYGRAIAEVVTAERFPVLAKVIADGAFGAEADDDLQDFRFGLDRILDGVEPLTATS